MLFGGYKPKTKTINIMLLDGGLGDHIASLVAVDYIVSRYTWLTPLIWVPDYLLDLAKHLLRKHEVEIFCFSQLRGGRYNPNYPTKTTKWDQIISPMKMPLVDYAFMKLCDENPEPGFKNYLKIDPESINTEKFELPDNYVVITTAYTAIVRSFPAQEVNKLSKYLLDKGLTPVFLGARDTKTGTAHTIKGSFDTVDFSKGADLIDKTNLLEAAKIMHNAKAVVGVDNGLLNLAACTQTPIVAGYTTVEAKHRIPYRNNEFGYRYYIVNPGDSLECRFCQSSTNFLYGHDYRNCLWKNLKPEKTNLCTKHMTAEKFISHLEYILS